MLDIIGYLRDVTSLHGYLYKIYAKAFWILKRRTSVSVSVGQVRIKKVSAFVFFHFLYLAVLFSFDKVLELVFRVKNRVRKQSGQKNLFPAKIAHFEGSGVSLFKRLLLRPLSTRTKGRERDREREKGENPTNRRMVRPTTLLRMNDIGLDLRTLSNLSSLIDRHGIVQFLALLVILTVTPSTVVAKSHSKTIEPAKNNRRSFLKSRTNRTDFHDTQRKGRYIERFFGIVQRQSLTRGKDGYEDQWSMSPSNRRVHLTNARFSGSRWRHAFVCERVHTRYSKSVWLDEA